MREFRYLSVCSGIGVDSVAWRELAWQCAGKAEIEDFPRAVLEHRFGALPVDFDHRFDAGSNVLPLFGDFTRIEAHHVGPVDLLVGGTPCQSFSIAGLRGGLADDRGNLALEYLRLANRLRPRWLAWENVPGVFSATSDNGPGPSPPPDDLDGSHGPCDGEEIVVEDEYDADEDHAFACVLAGFRELGYGFAYRTLDAQFFGVPQRRRRVFVVGHLGDWRRAAAVLFDSRSLHGDPEPRRQAGARPAHDLAAAVGGGGDEDGGIIALAHGQGGAEFRDDGGAPTLTCNHEAPIIAIQERAVSDNLEHGPEGKGWQEDCAYTLEARPKVQAIAFDTTQITHPENRSNPQPGDPSPALSARGHAPAIAFGARDSGQDALVDCSPTLRAGGHATSHPNSGAMPAVVFEQVGAEAQVRRMTPRECERLQGLPDDFTLIPAWAGRRPLEGPDLEETALWIQAANPDMPLDRARELATHPDGPRYKALGNAFNERVLRWIGQRIDAVDQLP